MSYTSGYTGAQVDARLGLAGTAVQTDDARLSDSREWTAATVAQAEAEAGTATTRRSWTAQRVRQAIVAWWASTGLADVIAGKLGPEDAVALTTKASPILADGVVLIDSAAGDLPKEATLTSLQATLGVNDKAPIASPTFTGTVSGITKSMVGLGNVDDTADTAKPISAATQAALDDKSPNAQAQIAVPFAAQVTLDLDGGANQMFGPLTLTGNSTLLNPSNVAVGAVVVLDIRQDATGGRTLSYDTQWKFPGGAPDLSTAASARDVLVGVVIASDYIAATLHKGVTA